MALEIEKLLRDCTVRVQSERKAGTGFFVAPGLVLTCAHIVLEPGQVVRVRWNQEYVPAQTIKFIWHDDDYPDLALLSVDLTSHPCVHLDASSANVGDQLYAYSYPGETDEESTHSIYEGPSGGSSELMRLKESQIVPGMSGSPLLNLRTYSVCGMMKKTRDIYGSDLGGRAVPVTKILHYLPELIAQQAAFHKKDHRWQHAIAASRSAVQNQKSIVRVLLGSWTDDLEQEGKVVLNHLQGYSTIKYQLEITRSQSTTAGEIRREVEVSDIYVGLLSQKYGQVVADNDFSAAELEIAIARNRQKPLLLYCRLKGEPEPAQRSLFDLLKHPRSEHRLREVNVFASSETWAEQVARDVKEVLENPEFSKMLEKKGRFSPRSGRCGLIASLGKSPGAVTGLYYALESTGLHIDYVRTVSTSNPDVEHSRQTVEIELKKSIDDYVNICIEGDEIKDNQDVVKFKRAFMRHLIAAALNGDAVAIGVTGGRTVMGALLAQAAQMEAPADSAFYQLTVPDEIEEDGRYPNYSKQLPERQEVILNPTLLPKIKDKGKWVNQWHLVRINFRPSLDDVYHDL